MFLEVGWLNLILCFSWEKGRQSKLVISGPMLPPHLLTANARSWVIWSSREAEDTVPRTRVWLRGRKATFCTSPSPPFFRLEQLQLSVGYSCVQQANVSERAWKAILFPFDCQLLVFLYLCSGSSRSDLFLFVFHSLLETSHLSAGYK